MPNTLEDNNFVLATEHGPARLSAPFQNVNAVYVLEQDMMQNEANYSPLALNTNHPTLPTYKLVSEGPPTIEGGVRTWTRKYAQIPTTWYDPSTINYNFIGFYGPFPPSRGSVDPGTAYGRERRVHFVKVKQQFDYYLIGTGGSYATISGIPIVEETKYRGPLVGGTDPNPVEVDVLWDTSTGGFTFAAGSDPTLADYKALMVTDAATADSFSIVVQGSRVSRWLGNIFQRETLYIKAQ